MKQRLLMLLLFAVVVALLVGLNAASYRQKPRQPDTEGYANRSSFNPGATGTQAWYSLLAESGRNVVRWQEPMSALSTGKVSPSVLVMVGYARRDITDKDTEAILRWVAGGGRLVLIYRQAPEGLAVTSTDWQASLTSAGNLELFSVDPSDQRQMTAGVDAVHPVQPGLFTEQVNAIQPSKFADNIRLSYVPGNARKVVDAMGANAGPPPFAKPPSPGPVRDLNAPVIYYAKGAANLVVELPYGSGSIVLVSDPYMVSNGGISLADNARLATNLVDAGGGLIAFDEYHQGYSSDSNRFFQFFEGTPVVAIFFQAVVLVGLVFYSQSRRFARAVPESEMDRLSKLEYVSAMAELQRRTRAWDLAIENIYSDFRRRAARLFGIDVKAATSDALSKKIAERGALDPAAVRETLLKCEEIIRGEPTNPREAVRLCAALRNIERGLGLRRGRDSS